MKSKSNNVVKKIVIIAAILALIAALICVLYYYLSEPYDLFDCAFDSADDVDEIIKAKIDLNISWSDFKIVDNIECLRRITDVLSKIKVKPCMFEPDSYRPLLGKAYYINFSSKDRFLTSINIADEKHILINMYDKIDDRYVFVHKAYIIVNDVDLTEILDLLIEYGYYKTM